MDPDVRVYKQTLQGDLCVHLFAPPGGVPCCGIVFFMCGGWVGFDAERHYPQSAYFASRGALALVAEVRVIEKHGTTPAECVIDAKSAIRWLRLHAGEWAVPADRIVASGGSAAGHVALCTAMVDGFEEPGEDESVSSAPNLICAFNPSVLPRIDESMAQTERVRMRIQKFGGVKRLRELSPTRAIRPGLPPVLIMHGDQDEITPLSDSRAFADAMAAAGNECRIISYPGEVHGFYNYRPEGNPRYVDTLRDMDRFLAEHGFLQGASKPTMITKK